MMARIEEDREDLIREATALVRRVEFKIDNEDELIFAGYKRSGNLSIYFNPDLVYHFDDQCRLRRAFIAPWLYRSNGTTLTRLKRVRTESTTELHSTDLPADELKLFQSKMKTSLEFLLDALKADRIQIVRQIPVELDLLAELSGSVIQSIKISEDLSPAIVNR